MSMRGIHMQASESRSWMKSSASDGMFRSRPKNIFSGRLNDVENRRMSADLGFFSILRGRDDLSLHIALQ